MQIIQTILWNSYIILLSQLDMQSVEASIMNDIVTTIPVDLNCIQLHLPRNMPEKHTPIYSQNKEKYRLSTVSGVTDQGLEP